MKPTKVRNHQIYQVMNQVANKQIKIRNIDTNLFKLDLYWFR